MDLQKLDFIFPFIVFGYGAVMLLILNSPWLVKVAEQRLPSEVWDQIQTKKLLALICFFVGGLWSLQNLWFF